MEKAKEILVNYIRKNEKDESNLKLGPECEYIIVERDSYKSVSYFGEKGVEYIFRRLMENGWEGTGEGDHILLLTKEDMVVTTEPGGQVEFSSTQRDSLEELEKTYIKFFSELIPILDELNYDILAIAYHPVTKIEEIKLLPKSRYDAMFEYFKTHGTMSHNMMKGTAGLQLSIDYTDEEDFRKKFVVANALTNAFYAIFDNGYFFEGEPTHHAIRAKIWENTDPNRSGLAKNAFVDDSYEGYAEYLVNTPAIFAYQNGEMVPVDEKIGELIDENSTKEEIEHLMTMVFPDIRVKNIIEIRMMDSVPYPYNFGALALLEGLLYDEENLNILYEKFKDLDREVIEKNREELYEKGNEAVFLGKTLKDWTLEFIDMAEKKLGSDKKYLKPLKEFIETYGSFYNKTEKIYKETKDVKKSVEFNAIKMEDICTQIR